MATFTIEALAAQEYYLDSFCSVFLAYVFCIEAL